MYKKKLFGFGWVCFLFGSFFKDGEPFVTFSRVPYFFFFSLVPELVAANVVVVKCRIVSVSAPRARCQAWLASFGFSSMILLLVLTHWKCHKPFKGGREVSYLHSAKL